MPCIPSRMGTNAPQMSLCDGQSLLPQFLFKCQDTSRYGPSGIILLPHGHAVSWLPQIDWLLQSSWWKHDMSWSTPGCMVGPMLLIVMGAEWKQGCWMLPTSYHVVGGDAGCMRCLITMGPTLGVKLLSEILFLFLTFVHRNLTCALGPMELKTPTPWMFLEMIIYLVLLMYGFTTVI